MGADSTEILIWQVCFLIEKALPCALGLYLFITGPLLAHADEITKVDGSIPRLCSALATADLRTLVISSAWANSGPVMKRYRPRAQGRAFSIKKQTCHISISVESVSTQTNVEVQN